MDIAADQEGGVWVGTAHGVSYLKDGNWTHYTKEDGLPHNKVGKILLDEQGAVWFGTYGGGVVRFDPRKE
jgi:ligand-binding sensor domain-containing protein